MRRRKEAPFTQNPNNKVSSIVQKMQAKQRNSVTVTADSKAKA